VSTIVLLDQLQAETCGGRGQRLRRVNTRVQGLEWVSVWLMRGPSVYVCSELYKRYSLSCRRGMKLLNIEYHLSEQLFPQLSSVSLPTFSSFHSLAVANNWLKRLSISTRPSPCTRSWASSCSTAPPIKSASTRSMESTPRYRWLLCTHLGTQRPPMRRSSRTSTTVSTTCSCPWRTRRSLSRLKVLSSARRPCW
jgi:hypothetical protein